MHIVRHPNIVFKMNKDINGIERTPFRGAFFGRNEIGPHKKNFYVPKELANRLIRNESKGMALLGSSKYFNRVPCSVMEENPSVETIIANDMFT